MKKSKIKLWELALLLALCISLVEASVKSAGAEHITESLLRFHVIAASDEPGDQALKLRLRDAVAPELRRIVSPAEDAAGAAELLAEHREEILSAARAAAEGERVEFLLGRESYGPTAAGDYTLPAGEYLSLRLVIGEGRGHNWWGVIFPCLDESCCEAAGTFSDEKELALILEDEGIELRFRFLELLRELFG